jgi:hypothetical protein
MRDRGCFRKGARIGAFVFCASVVIAGPAEGRQIPDVDSRPDPNAPGRSFSLKLDGALASAAAFRPEVDFFPAPGWTKDPLIEPSAAFRGARSDNAGVPAPSAARRFLTAAGELALIELLPWIYDRYIEDESFARISWHTVSENFKAGFGFDSDHFNINQSQHPYQGGLFFEAGRSNGYTYWESGLFALAGSLIWECCMENTQPSINDLVNTTLGGMARGEVQHRLSVMILDNTASGGDRVLREIGAALINPVGAVTRLVNGDMARQFPNSEDRFPDGFSLSSEFGYRHVEGPVQYPDQGVISFAARYGDPFVADVREPFDAFSASIDLNFPADPVITRFEERGILRSWELTDRTASARHVFEFSQEYEYINNQAQVFGAQMFSGGLLSRYALGHGLVAATDLDGVVIPLAGVKTTDFESPQTGRNYDYGPGGGVIAAVRLYGRERLLLSVGYGLAWVHTVNGASENNTLQFFRATATVPIAGPIGLGGGYRWYSQKTTYSGAFYQPRQTQSEWRAFVSIAFGVSGLRTPKS